MKNFPARALTAFALTLSLALPAAAIAKKTGAKLVATFDLGKALVEHMGYPKEQFGFETTGNMGGEIALLDGEVKVAFIAAFHSSDVTVTSDTPAAEPASS